VTCNNVRSAWHLGLVHCQFGYLDVDGLNVIGSSSLSLFAFRHQNDQEMVVRSFILTDMTFPAEGQKGLAVNSPRSYFVIEGGVFTNSVKILLAMIFHKQVTLVEVLMKVLMARVNTIQMILMMQLLIQMKVD
jgi:hypothetical protein